MVSWAKSLQNLARTVFDNAKSKQDNFALYKMIASQYILRLLLNVMLFLVGAFYLNKPPRIEMTRSLFV